MKFLVVLFLVGAAWAATDPECANYDHEDYGCTGQCVSTSSCPGGKYESGLCPSQAWDVKCCFTVDTDTECATEKHWRYGDVGHCIASSQCPYNNYVSNLCPNKAADVKCCFSKPTGTCDGGSCTTYVKSLACQIKDLHNAGKITLLTVNPSGVNDGADAYSNIIDACNGYQSLRSSYSCSSGTAPGGSVCLDSGVLEYLIDLANYGYKVQVNSISGACHSSNSYHYLGRAVDLQIGSGYAYWMEMCQDHGAKENLGPGYPGHDSHTHCAI